jgi:hypothetical protein
MTDEPIPCVRPFCPPVEEIHFEATIIRCPECGMSPYAVPSMWEVHDRHEWFCAEHGLVFVSERLADGRVEMTPQMREPS